jgi:hypothetical protein
LEVASNPTFAPSRLRVNPLPSDLRVAVARGRGRGSYQPEKIGFSRKDAKAQRAKERLGSRVRHPVAVAFPDEAPKGERKLTRPPTREVSNPRLVQMPEVEV